MTDLGLPAPDFSRWPESAHQLWTRLTASKTIAGILAADLTDSEDQVLADFLPELIGMAKALDKARAGLQSGVAPR